MIFQNSKSCRAITESCREEPMYMSTWVNIWSFDSTFMVLWCLLFTFVEWYVYSWFFSLLCICFNAVLCVWFHVECMKSKREEEWVSIVSLPENSYKECSKHLQGVRWHGSEFYLRKLRRDIVVLILAKVKVKYRVVQGVHRLVETLKVIN